MKIVVILIAIAVVTSIVMLIKEIYDAKKENRKIRPARVVVYGTIIGCAAVVGAAYLFLILITLVIVMNM